LTAGSETSARRAAASKKIVPKSFHLAGEQREFFYFSFAETRSKFAFAV
jgi:hypothetical protein